MLAALVALSRLRPVALVNPPAGLLKRVRAPVAFIIAPPVERETAFLRAWRLAACVLDARADALLFVCCLIVIVFAKIINNYHKSLSA